MPVPPVIRAFWIFHVIELFIERDGDRLLKLREVVRGNMTAQAESEKKKNQAQITIGLSRKVLKNSSTADTSALVRKRNGSSRKNVKFSKNSATNLHLLYHDLEVEAVVSEYLS